MIQLSNVPQSLCIKMILGFKPAIVLSAIVAEVDIQQLAHACNHRRRNDFQSGGGGAIFWKSKLARQRRPSHVVRRRGVSEGGCAPLKSWGFFWKCGLKWSDLVHYFSS